MVYVHFLFHLLKLFTEAFYLKVNTLYKSYNGLAYIVEKIYSVAEIFKQIYFCNKINQIILY